MNHLIHLFTALLLLLQAPAAPAAYSYGDPHPLPNEREDEEMIPWSDGRRLNWNDFKCAPIRNTEAVALTSTSLGISYKVKDGRFIYDISCSFSKRHSWGLLKTDYILAHEQAHFDITEIFARRLHQQLQQYRFNGSSFKHDINRIYQKVVREKETFQEQYDGQTDHSRKKIKQEEWLAHIAVLLENTMPYQNYP